jgi:hypothetical protein
LAPLILLLAGGGALAHHGWSWTLDEDFELSGTIEEIYLGNPHAALKVMAEDGLWQVELAPAAATARSGFVEGVASIGDPVTASGHRSADPGEKRMKAEAITVAGTTYVVYPNR